VVQRTKGLLLARGCQAHQRLHSFKVTRTAPRVALSEEEKEKRRVEALAERERYRQERSLKGHSSGQ
jgi:hypothetical protein